MTILFYVLNVVCSSGQSTLSKKYASRGGESSVFNMNKALAGILVFLTIFLLSGSGFHVPTWLFGFGYGVLLCLSMHTGFKALAMGPMALTSIIASFSLIIPFLFGITVWKETLSLYGLTGIFLLGASIVILNFKKESGVSLKWSVYTLLTMLANGICSLVQKYHQLYFPGLYRTEFMLSALLCVFILLVLTSLPKQKSRPFTFSYEGSLAGLLEGAANYIILYLAATQKASVLFPVVSVAKIITVWSIGRFTFKEKLKPLQLLGLILGAVSIVLLNLR